MAYEIKKGVPIPPKKDGGAAAVCRSMVPGDCIQGLSKRETASFQAEANKRLGKGHLATRKMPDGTYSIWRVEPKGGA